MEAWFRAGAASGFVLQFTHHPGPLNEFVDQVMPILVRRGLFRQDYEGRTLREHLGLPRPAWRESRLQLDTSRREQPSRWLHQS